MSNSLVSPQAVETTIATFLRLDKRGDRGAMNKIAQRLQREQPLILQYGAQLSTAHDAATGEAGVFYMTLAWSMFDHHYSSTVPRVTDANLAAAKEEIAAALAAEPVLAGRPVHERIASVVRARQPHICSKFAELIEEDVREAAMTEATATALIEPLQVVVEALDAAVSERRPGERQGTVVKAAETPGRNDACPCGSGKKYKKCHAVAP
ncbi:MAG: SEC-C domain-containing protein [Myxococcales bacterium]|nr:SEC-C domain-containing protein [Myxococcales bacterium]